MNRNTWVIFTLKCKIHECRNRGKFLRAKWYRIILKKYVLLMHYLNV